MGVKIFYRFYCEATIEEFVKKVTTIHEEIERLDIKEIEQKQGFIDDKIIDWFRVFINDGCDPFFFYMKGWLKDLIKSEEIGEYTRKAHIKSLSKGKIKWKGQNFTKTEFAVDRLNAHNTLVAILDICKKHGVLKCAFDTSYFWKHRDGELLRQNFIGSRKLIHKMNQDAIDMGVRDLTRADGRVYTDGEGNRIFFDDESDELEVE